MYASHLTTFDCLGSFSMKIARSTPSLVVHISFLLRNVPNRCVDGCDLRTFLVAAKLKCSVFGGHGTKQRRRGQRE